MRPNKFIAGLLLILLLFVSAANGQSTDKINARCKNVIDSTYNALLKKYKVVGMSLAIVDHGEMVYANGYGFADRENKIPANSKTIYRIGSCTKSFTALSILQLQEKGLLNIKNPLQQYLPEFKLTDRFNQNNAFCLRDMLSHVSGMPCDISNGFFCDAPPNMTWELNALNQSCSILPPRYKHAYSNVAFGLLGEVIARQSQSTYADYVHKKIFVPLQMTASYIVGDSGLSKAYVNNKLIKEPQIRDAAAGLIHSNVLDMSNYIKMYLNHGQFNDQVLLSPDNISEMENNQIADISLSSGESWGYGLYTKKIYCKQNNDSNAVRLIGHGGDTYAFHADFAYIPELNVGAVILTNTDQGTRINNAARLLKIYLKQNLQKTLNLNFIDTAAIQTAVKNDKPCNDAERIGDYNFNHFMIHVKNANHFSFKQGPVLLSCKRKKDDSAAYNVKAKLFSFIPLPFKGPVLKFIKKDGEVFMKTYNIYNKEEEYIGIKNKTPNQTKATQAFCGNYELRDAAFSCNNCPYMNAVGLKMTIKNAGNQLLLITKGKSSDMNDKYYLEVVSDNLAVTGGINRGDGEAVRILSNGDIYFSGFTFKKVK